VRPQRPRLDGDLAMYNARDLIPDRYLYQAVGTCCTDNRRLQLSKDVKDLIARFAPADRPTVNAIPQDQRRPFLNELARTTGRRLPPEDPIRAEPTLVEAALSYAHGGIPIFPCNPNNKSPLTAHGFKNATTDLERIRSWWREHPQAMIGVPTGSASGVFVIDLDVDEKKGIDGRKVYKDLCLKNGGLPNTIVQQTPRGGLHVLFRDEGFGVRNDTGKKLGPGVDIRGDGGYIVIAPSKMAGGKAYQWRIRGKEPGFPDAASAPGWLLDLCLGRKSRAEAKPADATPDQEKVERKHRPETNSAETAPDKEEPTPSTDQRPTSAVATAVLEQESNTVAVAPEGTRNDTLNKAAFSLGQSIAMSELDRGMVERHLTAACVKNGLVSPRGDGLREVNQTIKSGIDAGLREYKDASVIFGPPTDEWQAGFAYVEPLKEFVDLNSSNLQRYDLQAFKLKFPQFSPWAPKANAVIRYLQGPRKTICDGYTYLPGAPRLVDQDRRRLLNRWSPGLALLDRVISDNEIQPWLDHLKYLVSDPEESAVVLDWMAHLVQRQFPKANFAILLGGVEGIGKSLLFDPIVRFLGPENVRTTSEVEIKDKYTSWIAERELVMMEEIRGLSDEVMNRLKMYIAAPPYMVPVNEKNIKHYETPNVARFVAFTNSEYALQLNVHDRRWFVLWSGAEAQGPDYYTKLAKWFEVNAVLIGSWLAQRDLSGFAGQGKAPMTAAKGEMQLDALGSLDYWVHEAIANKAPPFETDLISVEDVINRISRLPWEARRNLRPEANEKSISMALKKAGAAKLDRVSLGKKLETTGASRTVLWAIRGQAMLRDLRPAKLVEIFWRQREERIDRPDFVELIGKNEKAP
jgi:Bifunctional DNA primase/polymerase, N-terminal/Family of unknown function (DUF5906)